MRSRPVEPQDNEGKSLQKRASPSPDLDDVASHHAGARKRRRTHRRWRRADPAAAQEQEIRHILELAEGCHNNLVQDGSDLPTSAMTLEQLNRKRDLGLATLVTVSNRFATSTATFVLSVSVFDKFLAKVVKVVHVEDGEKSPDLGERSEGSATVVPLACFIMACKICETYAPRLVDVAGDSCLVHELREAENNILERLKWDIAMLTGETHCTIYSSK